jgi:capsular polysaccharide biosynthesis protein
MLTCVTPVPETETAVIGLGLLRGASDPTRDVTTASLLIDNAGVARLIRADLRLPDSPQALLQEISVSPVANSSIVSIAASTGSPLRSQQLANAFATEAVQERTAQLYQALDPAVANLRARIQAITAGGNAASNAITSQPLYQQLAALEALRSGPDPTLRVTTPALLPTSPSAPRTKLIVAGGLIAGLLIGIAGAFVLKAFDPRRAREGGLGMTGLSILTRVPLLRRSGRTRHAFDEAFRSLRTTLKFASSDNPIGTIAITSPSEKEGRPPQPSSSRWPRSKPARAFCLSRPIHFDLACDRSLSRTAQSAAWSPRTPFGDGGPRRNRRADDRAGFDVRACRVPPADKHDGTTRRRAWPLLCEQVGGARRCRRPGLPTGGTPV